VSLHEKNPVVLASILFFLSFSIFSPAAAETVDLTILHINDFHGNLLPSRQGRKAGNRGMAYIAKMVSEEREKNPEGTLLLSAGDMFQGTPISTFSAESPSSRP